MLRSKTAAHATVLVLWPPHLGNAYGSKRTDPARLQTRAASVHTALQTRFKCVDFFCRTRADCPFSDSFLPGDCGT